MEVYGPSFLGSLDWSEMGLGLISCLLSMTISILTKLTSIEYRNTFSCGISLCTAEVNEVCMLGDSRL